MKSSLIIVLQVVAIHYTEALGVSYNKINMDTRLTTSPTLSAVKSNLHLKANFGSTDDDNLNKDKDKDNNNNNNNNRSEYSSSPPDIQISIISTANYATSASTALLRSLCTVTNDVIADGSGIGWTEPFDDPYEELMPYFINQAKAKNVHLLVAHTCEQQKQQQQQQQALGSLQLSDSINKFRCEATRHKAEVSCFFVSTKHRGMGIGYQLLHIAEEVSRDTLHCTKLVLDCRATQLDAIRLYERFGFNKWGTMKNYASLDGKVFYDGYFYDKDI